MSTLDQRLAHGDRAKEALENEAFTSAFEAIEKEVIDQWTNSPARDAQGREKLWTYLMMLRKAKAHLTSTMETGRLARLELDYQQSLKDRAKQFLGMNSQPW